LRFNFAKVPGLLSSSTVALATDALDVPDASIHGACQAPKYHPKLHQLQQDWQLQRQEAHHAGHVKAWAPLHVMPLTLQ